MTGRAIAIYFWSRSQGESGMTVLMTREPPWRQLGVRQEGRTRLIAGRDVAQLVHIGRRQRRRNDYSSRLPGGCGFPTAGGDHG